jgi:Lon protease-like protein
MAPQSIPLFPLGAGLFPDGLLALRIFEVRYLDMVKRALKEKSGFGVVLLSEGSEVRGPDKTERFHAVGTMAEIVEADALQPALLLLRCRGGERFRIEASHQGKYGLWMGEVTPVALDPAVAIPSDLQSAANRLGQLIAAFQKKGATEEQIPIYRPYRLDECGWVANRWAEMLPFSMTQRQELLEEMDPEKRLRNVVGSMGDLFESS